MRSVGTVLCMGEGIEKKTGFPHAQRGPEGIESRSKVIETTKNPFFWWGIGAWGDAGGTVPKTELKCQESATAWHWITTLWHWGTSHKESLFSFQKKKKNRPKALLRNDFRGILTRREISIPFALPKIETLNEATKLVNPLLLDSIPSANARVAAGAFVPSSSSSVGRIRGKREGVMPPPRVN